MRASRRLFELHERSNTYVAWISRKRAEVWGARAARPPGDASYWERVRPARLAWLSRRLRTPIPMVATATGEAARAPRRPVLLAAKRACTDRDTWPNHLVRRGVDVGQYGERTTRRIESYKRGRRQ